MPVYSFDDLDELFETEDKNRQAADARVDPALAEKLKPGVFFLRWSDEYPVPIYGEVLPLDPEDEEESGPPDSALQHYRFAQCYSYVCQMGEKGDVHVSTVTSILTPEAFAVAKENGWPPTLAAFESLLASFRKP